MVKKSAQKRGIPFLITIEEFTDFCYKTKYHLLRGKASGDLSVDRINNSLPYQADNIQAITIAENVSKGNRERHTEQEPDWNDYF